MTDIRDLGRGALTAAGLLALALATTPPSAWASEITERTSVSSAGEQANGDSTDPAVSADGRYVAFASAATNLVKGDTNGHSDVFVRDRSAGTTERVSVGPGGRQAGGDSTLPSLSADGRLVGFTSLATDLVKGDTNGASDAFVHDRKTGRTERVSVGAGGKQANGDSFSAVVSADGRYVAFDSSATKLVKGDTGGGVYVRDRLKGTTERADLGPGGVPADRVSFIGANAISAGGRFVAFSSRAGNLVPGHTGGSCGGGPPCPSDVFVRDRLRGTTEPAAVSRTGGEGNDLSTDAAISTDGRLVAFLSWASDLVPGDTNRQCDADGFCDGDIFVRNRRTDATRRVSVRSDGRQAVGDSFSPTISANGRLVAFVSSAGNLVKGDTNGVIDVFLRDRRLGRTERVSVSSNGEQGDDGSGGGFHGVAISADGHSVAYASWASTLVSGDTNDAADIFVRTR